MGDEGRGYIAPVHRTFSADFLDAQRPIQEATKDHVGHDHCIFECQRVPLVPFFQDTFDHDKRQKSVISGRRLHCFFFFGGGGGNFSSGVFVFFPLFSRVTV